MSKSTVRPSARKATPGRPAKPYDGFPLYAHPLGYWSKKINKKICHFGRWGRVRDGKVTPDEDYTAGWMAAEAKYKARVGPIRSGRDAGMVREPGAAGGPLTVRDAFNAFLAAKHDLLATGEIGPRTFNGYKELGELLTGEGHPDDAKKKKRHVDGKRGFWRDRLVTDLTPDDFAWLRANLAKPKGTLGPVRLKNEITRIMAVFRFAYDSDLIDRPVRFGPAFKKPGKDVIRKHKAANGGNMMEAAELRKLLESVRRPDLRAMILLMINCAFGPTDLALLPRSAVDLDGGWINYPRPKNGNSRRCPLWAESVAALRLALAARPEPDDATTAGLVFLSPRGRQLISCHLANPITILTTNAMKAAGVHRKGRGAYTGRHVFRTIADEANDRPAIDLVMGHADPTMAAADREQISDARLRAVVGYVRAWLFGAPATSPTPVEKKDGGAA